MRCLEDIFSEIEATPDFHNHKIDSINYKNDYGDTPIHVVSNWGDCEAIYLLVEAGANINLKGERGYTPLHCASEQNHFKAIKLLLILGAEIQLDDDGYSPLALAELLENSEAIEALKSTQNN
jgi:ankyrin repeat protein